MYAWALTFGPVEPKLFHVELHLRETIFYLVTPDLLGRVLGKEARIFDPASLAWKLYPECTLCEHTLYEHASQRGEVVTEPGIIAACRCCAFTTAVPIRIRQRKAWLAKVAVAP
jgi:hypothetical protein